MVTGRYSRLLRSGTDEMTHFHTKRNRRRRALEYGWKQTLYSRNVRYKHVLAHNSFDASSCSYSDDSSCYYAQAWLNGHLKDKSKRRAKLKLKIFRGVISCLYDDNILSYNMYVIIYML